MIISNGTPELIHHVALRMREDDFQEIVNGGWCDTREELAEFLARFHIGEANNVMVFGDTPDNPIAVAGAFVLRPGVWSVFMFATEDWPKIEKAGTKWARKHFFPSFAAVKAHRLECQSISTHAKAHQWLEFFGFKPESVLKGYGRNGEDYINYVLLNPKSGEKPCV